MTMNMIALSVTAQTKMALHAAKHGFSNPIHGIVLGRYTADGGKDLQVVDVVPVCHEVLTKPIADMALRLTDAYLRQQQEQGALQDVSIVGWYTANADGDDGGELPNSSACRIAAAIAETIGGNEEGAGGGECVLLLVSTARLANCIADEAPLPICAVFERDRARLFTQKVDESRVTIATPQVDAIRTRGVLSEALQMYLSYVSAAGDAAAGLDSIAIYDFVDHLTDCREADWIENRSAQELVAVLVG